MPDRVVLLHFGAHRTGTTYLQTLFAANRATLADRNITYVSIHQQPAIRHAFLRARYALRDGNSHYFNQNFEIVADFLSQQLRDHAGDLIISYEGFLGDLSFGRSHQIYPHHAALIANLMAVFEGERVLGALAIREYAAFVESGYKYLAQTGMRQSFRRYVERVDLDQLSWRPIVSHLQLTFGLDLNVWCYEDFARSPGDLVDWLLQRCFNRRGVFLRMPPAACNASVSRAALPALLLVNRVLRSHRKASNGIYKLLLRSLPVSRFGHPRLFDASVGDRLLRRYARDVVSMRADVPGFYKLPAIGSAPSQCAQRS